MQIIFFVFGLAAAATFRLTIKNMETIAHNMNAVNDYAIDLQSQNVQKKDTPIKCKSFTFKAASVYNCHQQTKQTENAKMIIAKKQAKRKLYFNRFWDTLLFN